MSGIWFNFRRCWHFKNRRCDWYIQYTDHSSLKQLFSLMQSHSQPQSSSSSKANLLQLELHLGLAKSVCLQLVIVANDPFKLRRGWRVSCCCTGKRTWVWRWIRCLLRRNATVAVRKCCSRTQGKAEDVIHNHGWKLIWKQEKLVGLLTDQLCLWMNCHRRQSCWKRETAGPPYLAGYVSMPHVIDLPFGFHDQESQGSLHTCRVKQNQSQTTTTTKPQIPSGSITGLWVLWGEAPPGIQSHRDTASFSGDRVSSMGHLLTLPQLAVETHLPIEQTQRWWESCM